MTLRARVSDVIRFARRPRFVAAPMPWGSEAARTFVIVFALSVLVAPAIAGLTAALDNQAQFMPSPDFAPRSTRRQIIDFLIIAPIFEELLFRSWLTGRRAALRFAGYGFAATGLLLAGMVSGLDDSPVLGWAAVAVVFAGLVHWGQTAQRDRDVPALFVRRYHWIVWGSTLLFGLVHLGNFTGFQSPLGLLAVLPQTVGGLLLAYTRTRLGLRAAMLHHAAFNAVWLLVDAAVF